MELFNLFLLLLLPTLESAAADTIGLESFGLTEDEAQLLTLGEILRMPGKGSDRESLEMLLQAVPNAEAMTIGELHMHIAAGMGMGGEVASEESSVLPEYIGNSILPHMTLEEFSTLVRDSKADSMFPLQILETLLDLEAGLVRVAKADDLDRKDVTVEEAVHGSGDEHLADVYHKAAEITAAASERAMMNKNNGGGRMREGRLPRGGEKKGKRRRRRRRRQKRSRADGRRGASQEADETQRTVKQSKILPPSPTPSRTRDEL